MRAGFEQGSTIEVPVTQALELSLVTPRPQSTTNAILWTNDHGKPEDEKKIIVQPAALNVRVDSGPAGGRDLALVSVEVTVQYRVRDLKAYENQQLTHAEQIDLSALLGFLHATVRFEDDVKPAERNPASYVNDLLNALYPMVAREYAPVEERARALLERLKGLGPWLETASRNLKSGYDLPAAWTEIAIETLDGADLFFREALAAFARRAGKLEEQLADAVEGGRRMLLRWKSFLRDEILPRCDGTFAIGRDCFEFLLEKRHGIHMKARDLVALGEEAIASIGAEGERLSADVPPPRRPDQIAPEKLAAAYEKEVKRAREFVARRGLVTLPEGDRLSVVAMPPFLRPIHPFAAYLPPGPFEQKQEGFLFVAPAEGQTPPAVATIAVHEAYPGHHLQILHSNRAASKARRVIMSPVFVEGWALYCENLMLEEGYFGNGRARLEVLRKALWRACRVVIDVKLQLQQMTFDEAVDMLVATAGIDRAQAIADVRWYVLQPTCPLSYLVGKREIARIRDELRQIKGEKFKAKDFHDKLLSLGSIPLNLARDALLK